VREIETVRKRERGERESKIEKKREREREEERWWVLFRGERVRQWKGKAVGKAVGRRKEEERIKNMIIWYYLNNILFG